MALRREHERAGRSLDLPQGDVSDALLGRALRLSLVEHDWDAPVDGLADLLRGRPLERLVELASMHGVTNSLFVSLQTCPDIDATSVQALRSRYQKGLARMLRAGAELRALAGVMSEADLPWLVFKGPVVAGDLYARPDLRSWGDIDILIPPAAFERGIDAMCRGGSRLLDIDWRTIVSERRSQLHLGMPLGSVADVHWHLLNRRFVRDALSIRTEDLMSRAVQTTVEGVCVPTLDAEDTLLHLCLHAALSGGNRLRWIKDIERAAAVGVDWDAVVDRAVEWRACRPVGLMLRRAERTLAAAVPAGVIAELLPQRFSWFDDRMAQRWPIDGQPREHRHVSSLWPRSVRDDVAGSAAALSARTREAVERRRRSHTQRPGDATDTLESYLDAIAGFASPRRPRVPPAP